MNRLFYKKLKNVSCDYNGEWLKLIPQLNETVKQDKIREEPENRIGAVCVEYGRDWVLFSRLRPGRVGGRGIAASTLFQQADVGKIPATVKH